MLATCVPRYFPAGEVSRRTFNSAHFSVATVTPFHSTGGGAAMNAIARSRMIAAATSSERVARISS